MARGQTTIDCSSWLHLVGDPVDHVRIPIAPVLLFDAVLYIVFMPFVYKICFDTSRMLIVIVLICGYSLVV